MSHLSQLARHRHSEMVLVLIRLEALDKMVVEAHWDYTLQRSAHVRESIQNEIYLVGEADIRAWHTHPAEPGSIETVAAGVVQMVLFVLGKGATERESAKL